MPLAKKLPRPLTHQRMCNASLLLVGATLVGFKVWPDAVFIGFPLAVFALVFVCATIFNLFPADPKVIAKRLIELETEAGELGYVLVKRT